MLSLLIYISTRLAKRSLILPASLFYRHSNPVYVLKNPPPGFLRCDTTSLRPRWPASQLSFKDLLAFEALGGRTDLLSSSIRTLTGPLLISLSGFGSASINLRFLEVIVVIVGGGVGRRITGSAARISSGSRAGKGPLRLTVFPGWRFARVS